MNTKPIVSKPAVSKPVDIETARSYYEKGPVPADSLIEHKLIKGSPLIIHGNRAINAYLPAWLDKATEDWDIFSETPKETAIKLEKLLDNQYGGDYFTVEPAKHEGTFRVVNKVTLRAVADITIPDRKINYTTIDGVNYATLEHHAEQIKKTLLDPDSKYRWNKDTETLQRINIHKQENVPQAKQEVNHKQRAKYSVVVDKTKGKNRYISNGQSTIGRLA